jgi:biopolymer transport protein ExbD
MKFIRPSPRHDGDNNLISLINVVFLILVFFMLMGRLTPDDILDIDSPASASTPTVEPESVTILIAANGRIAVDSRIVTKASLGAVLRRKFETAKFVDTPGVTIKADGKIQVKQLNHAFDILRSLGAGKITLVTDRTR